jgi:hypothetical protein
MTAVFSPCGQYRYRLDRLIPENASGMTVAFVLHNPSTAGEDHDDPTSRRGIGFARRFNASRLIFVNLFAGIATRPHELWAMADPVGPNNARHLATVACEVERTKGFCVFAWGAVNPPKPRREHVQQHLWAVEDIVRKYCPDVRCLGLTKSGGPRHPLYLPADAGLAVWQRPIT